VTIGIGFKCNDGLVIATDTRYTRGSIKSHGPKMFPLFAPIERPDLAVVIAGAGRVPFMKRAVECIEAELAKCTNPTMEDVRDTVEAALIEFHKKHIWPTPQPKDYPIELIIGAWSKASGRFDLLTSDETTVTRVAPHGSASCTIGCGQYVSEYALGLTYQVGMSVEDAKFVAAFCIKAAKDYVDFCGGSTQIYTIKNRSPFLHSVISQEVKDAELYSEELYSIVKNFIHLLDTDANPGDDPVAWLTDYMKQSVVQFRDKIKKRKERIKAALTRYQPTRL
jgi:20S proteasome alpha/beta subunit